MRSAARPADWSTRRTKVLRCSMGLTVSLQGRSDDPMPTSSRSAASCAKIVRNASGWRMAKRTSMSSIRWPSKARAASLAAIVREPSMIKAGSSSTPISKRARSGESGIAAAVAQPRAARLGGGEAALALSSPMAAPSADDDDQENRIDPEARRGGIGLWQQVDVDRLENMSHGRRQLKAGNPERPKAVGSNGYESKTDERQDIGGEDAQLDIGESLVKRRVEDPRDEGREDTNHRGEALVQPSASEGIGRHGEQQDPIGCGAKHSVAAGLQPSSPAFQR